MEIGQSIQFDACPNTTRTDIYNNFISKLQRTLSSTFPDREPLCLAETTIHDVGTEHTGALPAPCVHLFIPPRTGHARKNGAAFQNAARFHWPDENAYATGMSIASPRCCNFGRYNAP